MIYSLRRKLEKEVLGEPDNDAMVVKAMEVLKKRFINKKNKPIRTPYYQHQIQVLYEGDFFEWVITKALRKLEEEGYLTSLGRTDIPELAKLNTIASIRFYVNSKAVRTSSELKRMKKRVINIAKIVEEYSNDRNAKVRGNQLESLVKNQLEISQFEIMSKNTNEYKGEKWIKTEHDLDFIAKKKGTNFVIGVEVKNTLSFISKDEQDIKMDICDHLGIVPVFAVRWLKPYIENVESRGGFSWIFKTQIHPFGYEDRVKKWYKKFSILDKVDSSSLKFPITVRNDLPIKSVKVFDKWVQRETDV